MRSTVKWIVSMVVIAALIVGACVLKEYVAQNAVSPAATTDASGSTTTAAEDALRAVAKATTAPYSLKDIDTLYDTDPASVISMYITTRRGNSADGTDHTFKEVSDVIRVQGMQDVAVVKCEAIVQFGDETGPLPGEVGYGATQANASIRIRGRTATRQAQKSYRIDLYDSAGLWRGQRAIAINKHAGDVTRARNKLFFDTLHEMPGMLSLRTQFVHVYVKDETATPADTAFVDYGLFTQVEIPNRRYLKNHQLSADGSLYKAEMFEFYRYPDKLKLATDPTYDETDFTSVLESKTGNDHSKLLTLVDEVNDYSIPIETVFEKHFDPDNYFGYYAFNLLMANFDSSAQNYLLYSPANSQMWYYLLWDGDGGMTYYEDELRGNEMQEGTWTRGVSDYWGVVLFNRVMRVEKYRQMLNDKVEQFHKLITPQAVQAKLDVYKPVIDRFITTLPDSIHSPVDEPTRKLIWEHTPDEINIAYRLYQESLQKPMPFFMGDAALNKELGLIQLNWDEAYDFSARTVTYDVIVADNWQFASGIVLDSADQPSLTAALPLDGLKPGTYYWRVTARNSDGYTQEAFDAVTTAEGRHNGVRAFVLTEEGEVEQVVQ